MTSSVNKESTNFDLNADWIIENKTQIRFSPIALSNGNLLAPKIGFDRSFKDYTFSAITDFSHINIDLVDSNQFKKKGKLSKSIKLMMEKGAMLIIPKVEYDLTRNLKLIAQIMISVQDSNVINLSLMYGYKLQIAE